MTELLLLGTITVSVYIIGKWYMRYYKNKRRYRDDLITNLFY